MHDDKSGFVESRSPVGAVTRGKTVPLPEMLPRSVTQFENSIEFETIIVPDSPFAAKSRSQRNVAELSSPPISRSLSRIETAKSNADESSTCLKQAVESNRKFNLCRLESEPVPFSTIELQTELSSDGNSIVRRVWRTLVDDWRVRYSAILLSMIAHILLLILLTSFFVTPQPDQTRQFKSAIVDTITFEEFTEPTLFVEVLPTEPESIDVAELFETSPLASVLLTDERDELSGLAETTSTGSSSGEGTGMKNTPSRKDSAQFFGANVKGNSFVFIVDKSASMARRSGNATSRQTRLDNAFDELMRSVGDLSPDQEFYVILFSDTMHTMSSRKSVSAERRHLDSPFETVKATTENKGNFSNWLYQHRASGGTSPIASILTALKMRPDAIFLLSDGDFGGRKAALHNRIVEENRSRIPIHTILFESWDGGEGLSRIAELTDGTFRAARADEDRITATPSEKLRLVPDYQRRDLIARMLRSKKVNFRDRVFIAHSTLIPDIRSGTLHQARTAEEQLQLLSFECYSERPLFSVRRGQPIATVSQEDRDARAKLWNDRWNFEQVVRDTEDLFEEPAEESTGAARKRILTASDMLRVEDSLHQRQLLFVLCGFTRKKPIEGPVGDRLQDITNQMVLAAGRFPVYRQVRILNACLRLHEQKGMSSVSKQLLLEIATSLNDGDLGRSDSWIANAAAESWKGYCNALLAKREREAKRLLVSTRKSFTNAEARELARAKIRNDYPETQAAATLREEIGKAVKK